MRGSYTEEQRAEREADRAELVSVAIAAIERVFTVGDGRSMPTIERNAVDRDKAITDAAALIADGLHAVADAIRETRTK